MGYEQADQQAGEGLLLRSLSKQRGREVLIAVHESPLFDCLALELSPAYPDDRLITIELGRVPITGFT